MATNVLAKNGKYRLTDKDGKYSVEYYQRVANKYGWFARFPMHASSDSSAISSFNSRFC